MSVFISSYEKTIDKKGRVVTPNEFRKVLVGESFNGIISFASYHFPCVECMKMSDMEKLNNSIYEGNKYPLLRGNDDIVASIFAESHMLSFDNDGRIVIPKALTEHAMIRSDLVFVGRGSSFQIWNRDLYKEHQDNARRIIREKYAYSSSM